MIIGWDTNAPKRPALAAGILRRVFSFVLVLAYASTGAAASPQYVSAWGTALVAASGKVSLAKDEFSHVTLRQTMRLSLGGDALRIRISNLHGAEALSIGAGSIGTVVKPGDSEAVAPPVALQFAGAFSVTVPAGEERYSDPVHRKVARGDDVVISLFVEQGPSQQSAHTAAHATQFIAKGNQASTNVLVNARPLTSWFQVDAIEVIPPGPRGVLVAIGDSLTDGSGSGLDRNERWTDFLVRRLQRGEGAEIGVINAGIGGNRMLRDGIGPHLLSRFDRDVLSRPGVTHALVLIGVNDLGRLHKGTGETPAARQAMLTVLQAGWRQLVQRAHARGVCVIAGTLTPYGGSSLYKPDAQNEVDRQAVNQWLRTSADVDGVADFDAAVRDPGAPERLRIAFDSGDHLHLSPAGYAEMADSVPVEKLVSCRQQTPRAPSGGVAATLGMTVSGKAPQ